MARAVVVGRIRRRGVRLPRLDRDLREAMPHLALVVVVAVRLLPQAAKLAVLHGHLPYRVLLFLMLAAVLVRVHQALERRELAVEPQEILARAETAQPIQAVVAAQKGHLEFREAEAQVL